MTALSAPCRTSDVTFVGYPDCDVSSAGSRARYCLITLGKFDGMIQASLLCDPFRCQRDLTLKQPLVRGIQPWGPESVFRVISISKVIREKRQ